MEQTSPYDNYRNPWPIPAINVLLNRLGYVLIGLHDVTMTDGVYKNWESSVLHYRSGSERRNMLVWLGSMGWDPEGRDAYCDYKLFWQSQDRPLPTQLKYDKAKHTAVFWEWSTRYSYMREPFGDHLIKPKTVHWMEYKIRGFR